MKSYTLKLVSLFLLLGFMTSCLSPEYSLKDNVPVVADITPAAFNENTQSVITLSYIDADSDLANACTISNLSNVTVTQVCSCNSSGVCKVGVTGTANYSGAASFKYTVTANGQTAAVAKTASLTINSVSVENSVYIDPTFSGSNQDGSISRPFNSWTKFALQNGYNYFQKRGTTYSSGTQISVSSKSDIRIGAYGTGARPIFSYTGSGYAFYVNQSSSITIENFEVNGNGSAFSLVSVMGSSGSYTNSNVINNCLLHNSHNTNNGGFGVYGFYNNNLKVLNTEIHNIALDGMYLKYNPGVEIGYTHIHDINRRYFLNSNQTASSGDGIQLDGNYNGFHIHHSNIDRTNGAGNKFNVILNSAPGLSDGASGIIEYNTFTTDSTVSTALHIERGNGIITRYNTFKGVTQGLRIGGGYTSNNLIHNNLFYNCTSGIGIGYSYPSGGPAINTKVYNNVFYHVTSKHIWVDQTNVVAKNNIHVRTNDSGVSLYNYGGGSWSISDNCYSSAAVAGTPGTGTNPVIGNPLFVNPSAFNFHLQSGSPCIDSGSSVGILKDFDQISIPQNGVPDIGAFEYH